MDQAAYIQQSLKNILHKKNFTFIADSRISRAAIFLWTLRKDASSAYAFVKWKLFVDTFFGAGGKACIKKQDFLYPKELY